MKPFVDASTSHLRRPVPIAWQIFILLTSVAVLLVMGVSLLMPLPAEVKRVPEIPAARAPLEENLPGTSAW